MDMVEDGGLDTGAVGGAPEEEVGVPQDTGVVGGALPVEAAPVDQVDPIPHQVN